MDIFLHSLIRLAKRAEPMMTEGGTIMTVSYHGAERGMNNYNITGPVKAALEATVRYLAVQLVCEGRARALMKGALHTDEIMSAVVAKHTGLRTERRMSRVYVMDVPTYVKPLIITDAAINIGPDL